MTIDLTKERPVSFNGASRFLPDDLRPHATTWWRWWKKGRFGVRLETVVIGGRRYTTKAAVRRFITALTAASSGTVATTTTEPDKDSSVEDALDAAGI